MPPFVPALFAGLLFGLVSGMGGALVGGSFRA